MGTVYKKWMERIQDTERPWTESEIIYFRKAIGAAGIKDAEVRKELHNLFWDTLHGNDYSIYRITDEHSTKGQRYLLERSLRRDGGYRKNSKLGYREIGILRALSHHLFVGLYRPQGGLDYYLPVYRAVALDGQWFEYVGATYEQVIILSGSYSNELRLVVGGNT